MKRNTIGFTLIELLIVVVIIGILAAIRRTVRGGGIHSGGLSPFEQLGLALQCTRDPPGAAGSGPYGVGVWTTDGLRPICRISLNWRSCSIDSLSRSRSPSSRAGPRGPVP
jgi:prepilin-type N-terminal cleavage/methylation domain-containing protein